MTNATLTAAEGTSDTAMAPTVRGIPRSLYLVVNYGIQALSVLARDLYVVENVGREVKPVLARSLYLYEAVAINDRPILARSLYLYESTRDGEVFPWLMAISPTEQYRGGTVDLMGDGLGEILEAAAGSTITSSAVSGANVAANAVDRLATDFLSTAGASSWIRFTFGAAKKISAIVLEDAATGAWGVPRFRFSDGLGDVDGSAAVPAYSSALSTSEYPVGMNRSIYTLPSPRTTTYVEVAIASGGSGSTRGLREVWILEDLDESAETSAALLGTDAMGIVSWSNRSPGLYPANGGQPITKAATVTVPSVGESGLVVVREST